MIWINIKKLEIDILKRLIIALQSLDELRMRLHQLFWDHSIHDSFYSELAPDRPHRIFFQRGRPLTHSYLAISTPIWLDQHHCVVYLGI
jgi:hypothetical protein